MNTTAILSTYKPKGLFSSSLEKRQLEDNILLYIKDSRRALKKLKNYRETDVVVIAKCCEKERIFHQKSTIYSECFFDAVFPVMEKLCFQTAEKYNMSIPVSEIYIEASPPIACAIATGIHNLAKIFTVVSGESVLPNIYDELYFKHGTVIRHLPEYNNNITKDAIVIRCEAGRKFPRKIPVINLCPQKSEDAYTVNAFNACVYDEQTEEFRKHWGGVGGLFLYGLLGILPTEKTVVDIGTNADEIFLLDTDKI